MGQKTHPTGLRLGVLRTPERPHGLWKSRWYGGRDFPALMKEDQMLRAYVLQRLQKASVSLIEIERQPKRISITVHTARPGIVIGRKGQEVDKLRDELRHLTKKDVFINIEEIKKPELDAELVAQNIRRQLEGRVLFRRAMKKALENTMRMGAQGIRVVCSGRLGGAEMSRTERYIRGRVPLHTLRADIDYALVQALTTMGMIGVKVWICRGEQIGDDFPTAPRRAEGTASGMSEGARR